MKTLILKRIADNKDGTFGVLLDGQIPFALTLERQWLNNEKGKSCIPVGEYTCKRVLSPKFGDTFEVQNVPNRSNILFHKGNINYDTHGCLLVGEQFEKFDDKTAVLSSAKGFSEFMERLKGEKEFLLRIYNFKIN